MKKTNQQILHEKHERLTKELYEKDDFNLLPSRYVFVITNLCNLKCKWCYQSRKPRKDAMTTNDWIEFAKQIPDYARVTITGGEPFLFKGFKEVFSYVAKNNDCNIITNTTLLTKELSDFLLDFKRFKHMSVSIDGVKNNLRPISIKKWEETEEQIKYLLEKRKSVHPDFTLGVKTMILDENAEQLLAIRKYCAEELKVDSHTFQFLKGSEIQHSDITYNYEDIFKKIPAPIYEKKEIIKQQLKQIQGYNIKNNKKGYLHPGVGSLMQLDNLEGVDIINQEFNNPEYYSPCEYPWSSVHINVDGSLYPCLAILMGNVKQTSLKEIISGEKMQKFRKIIRSKGEVEACNRCGWLKPKNLENTLN